MKKIILFSLLTPAFSCFATPVLPVSTGQWDTGPEGAASTYSCGHFKQFGPISNQSSSALATANSVVSNLARQDPEGCTWVLGNKGQGKPVPSIVPWSFGDVSNKTVWNSMSSNSPNTMQYTANCIYSGGSIADTRTFYVFPRYQCPKGSAYSTISKTCDTQPTVCDADVVKRALNINNKYAQKIGHVALTESPMNVLEVLDDDVVVHTGDTFKSFSQHPSSSDPSKTLPFYGAKYGYRAKPGYPVSNLQLTLDEAQSMLNTGRDQANYDPIYTLFWGTQIGGLQNADLYVLNAQDSWVVLNITYQRAQFRCDTFVNYLLNKYIFPSQGGYAVPQMPGSLFTIPTPSETFDYMTTFRFTGVTPSVEPAVKTRSPYKGTLPQALNAMTPNLKDMNTALYHFMNNLALSKQEKAEALWQMAETYRSSPQKFGLLIDAIGHLHEPSMIPKMVTVLNNPSVYSSSPRNAFNTTINGMWVDKAKSTYPSVKQDVEEGLQEINKLAQTSTNPILLRDVAMVAPSVMTPTQGMTILNEAYQRIQKLNLKIQNGTLPALSNLEYQMTEFRISVQQPSDFSSVVGTILKSKNDNTAIAACDAWSLNYFPYDIPDSPNKKALAAYLKSQTAAVKAAYNKNPLAEHACSPSDYQSMLIYLPVTG